MLPVPIFVLLLMALAFERSLYNKNLPLRYIGSQLIERIISYWLSAVSISYVLRVSREPSVTLSQVGRLSIPSTPRTAERALRFGPVVNAWSFSTNN